MDEEQGSSRGVWAGFILAAVAAIVFAALWYLRGGEMDSLRRDMASAQTTASSNAQRLERELQSARDDAARRAADLEARLADEQRRAADAAQQAANRARTDIDIANSRLAEANARVEELETAAAQAGDQSDALGRLRTEIGSLTRGRDEARKSAADAQETIRRLEGETEALNARVADMTNRLADAGDESGAALAEALAAAETARTELTGQLDAARARGAERETALQAEIAALRENANQALREGTAEAERVAAELSAQLNAANEARQQLLTQADALRERLAVSRKRVAELEAAQAKPVPATNAAPASPPAPAAPAASAAPEVSVGGGDAAGPQNPQGQIVELLSDGKTYLVNSGGFQSVSPGMRFDVSRRENNALRPIGQIQVVSVLSEEFSMAVSVPPAEPGAPNDAPAIGDCVGVPL